MLGISGRRGVQGAEPGPVLSWNQRVKIAYGAARGLEYLHEKVQPPIVHRDVRSGNVLLFDDFLAKIAEFNLSNQFLDTAARLRSARVLGTFGYHAPEQVYQLFTADSAHRLSIIHVLAFDFDFFYPTSPFQVCHDGGRRHVYSFGVVVLLDLHSGRKPVDRTMPKGQPSLVTWVRFPVYFPVFQYFLMNSYVNRNPRLQATPRLSEDKVKQCADPKLNNGYHRKRSLRFLSVS